MKWLFTPKLSLLGVHPILLVCHSNKQKENDQLLIFHIFAISKLSAELLLHYYNSQQKLPENNYTTIQTYTPFDLTHFVPTNQKLLNINVLNLDQIYITSWISRRPLSPSLSIYLYIYIQ